MTKAPPDPDPEDMPDVCPRCGERHWSSKRNAPTCTGHRNRKTGQPLRPCLQPPVEGHHVCRYHGGKAPQVASAAARNKAEADFEDKVRRLALRDIPEEYRRQNPVEGLLLEVALSAYMVNLLADEMSILDMPDPHDDGPLADVVGVTDGGHAITRQPRSMLYGPDHNDDLAVHPLWKKFDEERDRHARMCKAAIDAGVSERLVRIAEMQGGAIVEIIVGTLGDLGLPADVRDEAKRIAARRIREMGTDRRRGLIPGVAREISA